MIPTEYSSELNDMAQIVHTISNVLANAHISIYQLSTFNADLTMVPESVLDSALHVLSSHFQVIPFNDVHDQKNLEKDTHHQKDWEGQFEEGKSPLLGTLEIEKEITSPISNTLEIVSLRDSSQYHQLLHPIIRLTLLTSHQPFFSFSKIMESICIVLDSER